MIGDRELWALDREQPILWGHSAGRRAQLDAWLAANGMPPGSMLRGGTVRAVRDLLGRTRLLAETLDGTRTLRRPLVAAPPPKLILVRRGAAAGSGRRSATGGADRRTHDGTPA